jgi:hypothetical protein
LLNPAIIAVSKGIAESLAEKSFEQKNGSLLCDGVTAYAFAPPFLSPEHGRET